MSSLTDTKTLEEVLEWLQSSDDEYPCIRTAFAHNCKLALTHMRNLALEEAAQVCQSNNEVYQTNGKGWRLEPKIDERVLNGQTYAAGIRALKTNEDKV